ncbi:MAG: PDZ domain-containing protein, partial [Pseudonocardiales bacterium]|nr:PDZ domain-containing protein [Pseudonocardiales bacterium]
AATATDVADQLKSTGRARHAFAGFEPAQITPQIAAQLGLPGTDGVIVAAVVPGGPAANAGLRPGDVITVVGTTPTRTPEDFLGALRRAAPGDTVTVTFHGPGRGEAQARLTLTDRPAIGE